MAKRTKFESRPEAFIKRLFKDIYLCISEFLVTDRPWNINPFYKYDETNLRNIKPLAKNHLMDLIHLVEIDPIYRRTYFDLLQLLKLYYRIKKYSAEYLDVMWLASLHGISVELTSPVTDFNFACLQLEYTGGIRFIHSGTFTNEDDELFPLMFTDIDQIPKDCLYVDNDMNPTYYEGLHQMPVKNIKIAKDIEIENRVPFRSYIRIKCNRFIPLDHVSLMLDYKFPLLKKRDIRIILDEHLAGRIEYSMRIYPSLTLSEFKEIAKL